jgi:phosphoribosylformylglycinamidine (FGAM) synthase-like amidotransferase family enzyme
MKKNIMKKIMRVNKLEKKIIQNICNGYQTSAKVEKKLSFS